jgi:hypothetical protein
MSSTLVDNYQFLGAACCLILLDSAQQTSDIEVNVKEAEN